MSGINKVVLIGRLGKDPERKETRDGKEFSKFSLATSRKVRDEEVTQWHNVVVWNENNARYVNDFAQKGTLLYVEGEIEYRTVDGEGGTRYFTDIVIPGFGGTVQILKDGVPREEGHSGSTRKPARSYANEKTGTRTKPKPEYSEEQRAADRADFDDDIPF